MYEIEEMNAGNEGEAGQEVLISDSWRFAHGPWVHSFVYTTINDFVCPSSTISDAPPGGRPQHTISNCTGKDIRIRRHFTTTCYPRVAVS